MLDAPPPPRTLEISDVTPAINNTCSRESFASGSRFNNFQAQILKEIRQNNVNIANERKNNEKVNKELLILEERLVKAEEKRNEILEKFVKGNENVQNAMINYFNNYNK